MKAILKYTDCLHDGKRVSSVLYENNIQILRIRPGKSIYPQLSDEEFVRMMIECGIKSSKKPEESDYIKAFYPNYMK